MWPRDFDTVISASSVINQFIGIAADNAGELQRIKREK